MADVDLYTLMMGMEPDAAATARAMAQAIRGNRQAALAGALGTQDAIGTMSKLQQANAAQDENLMEKGLSARLHYGEAAKMAQRQHELAKMKAQQDFLAEQGARRDRAALERTMLQLAAAQRRAETPKPGAGAAAGQVDDKVLDLWATQRRGTGAFPVQARGEKGAAIRELIDQRALEQDPNFDPTEVIASAGADKSALAKMQSTREGLSAFEQTLVKNAKLLGDAAKKMPNTGVPVLNRPVRALYRALGDVPTAQAEVGFRSVQAEAARVVSTAAGNGVITDTARKEWEDAINAASTPEQLDGVIKYITQETGNRIGSMDEGIKGIRDRIKARSAVGGDNNKNDPLGIK